MKPKNQNLAIVLYTSRHRIDGTLRLIKQSRLTDILNSDSQSKLFLPITDAHVIDLHNSKHFKAPFISVNKEAIEIIMEKSEEQ